MSHTPDLALVDFVRAKAVELEVPGASVGVIHDGIEHYAFAGVTSLENPLPVNADTLFQIGSTTKTVTATAIMLLAERDLLELDAPVRRYVPDLVLQDESVAEKVTVLQLLNHTAGWSGDLMQDTGDGDDALAQYVGPDGDDRAGLPPRRRGVLQQRLSVPRRPGDREGDRARPTSRRYATSSWTRCSSARAGSSPRS
jgi:CubicO group peptidase (beta-lactamase class C family)